MSRPANGNTEFRQYAKRRGVLLWEVADALGIADTTLSKLLRHELPEAEKEKYKAAVDQIAAQKAVGA